MVLLKNVRTVLAVALVHACVTIEAQSAPRPGKVQFSNSEVVEGKISLSPGQQLRLHVEAQIRTLTLDKVREIRMLPEGDEMVRNWRFKDAGQAVKEYSGKPYPLRSLKTTITLADGERITGHLYTTVLYVEGPDKARKVVLYAKQRGQEGETFDKVVYPAVISFSDGASGVEETIRVRIRHPSVGTTTELAALTHDALMTLEGHKTGQAGEYHMSSPLGEPVFLALKTGSKIVAGWPKEQDPKLMALVQTNLAIAEDFFDDRRLLGIWLDQKASDIYSLLMLTRKGQTTLDGEKTQPWRLVILRWKYDEDSQRVMLAGRGFFFRGILAKGETPPSVEITDALWGLKKDGEVWVPGRP